MSDWIGNRKRKSCVRKHQLVRPHLFLPTCFFFHAFVSVPRAVSLSSGANHKFSESFLRSSYRSGGLEVFLTPLRCWASAFFLGGEFIIVPVWPCLLHCVSNETECAWMLHSTVSAILCCYFSLNAIPWMRRVRSREITRGMLSIHTESIWEAVGRALVRQAKRLLSMPDFPFKLNLALIRVFRSTSLSTIASLQKIFLPKHWISHRIAWR